MSSRPEAPVTEIAELLAWFARSRPATLGGRRLVCVDGAAGSGKTTLAHALFRAATALGSARSLHMDDMYEGWSGLGADLSDRIARDLLGPLRDRRPGRYQRYDWAAGRFAEWHQVEPVDTLVLEGVGSGASAYDDAITVLVWVDAPRDLRLARGVARDGEDVLPNWLSWMRDEQALFARERTRERATVVVDGTGTAEHTVLFD